MNEALPLDPPEVVEEVALGAGVLVDGAGVDCAKAAPTRAPLNAVVIINVFNIMTSLIEKKMARRWLPALQGQRRAAATVPELP